MKLDTWVLLAIIVNILWNIAAFGRLGGLPVFLGMIVYFALLYKIAKIRNLNPWFTAFGVLNIIGLIVILLADPKAWSKAKI